MSSEYPAQRVSNLLFKPVTQYGNTEEEVSELQKYFRIAWARGSFDSLELRVILGLCPPIIVALTNHLETFLGQAISSDQKFDLVVAAVESEFKDVEAGL